MPSLVSDNFRIFAADQFLESVEEPYTDSSGTTVSDGDSGGLSDAYRSKIYLFTGRSQSWDATLDRYATDSNVGEFNPPDVVDSFNNMNEIYDDMISAKRILRTDLSKVVKRRTWTANTKYDMYRNDISPSNPSINGQSKLFDALYYVVNSKFEVYKCIFNGKSVDNPTGVLSTVEPDNTSSNIFSTSDSYRWKYMYTIDINDYIKFVSTDFMPVKTNTTVSAAAVDGAIDQLTLDGRGSTNSALTAGNYWCPIVGDGTDAVAKVSVYSTGSNVGKISSIEVADRGSGYTRGKVLLQGYSSVSNAQSKTGTPANLTGSIGVIISPPGGHGKDPAFELGGYRVMVSKSLDFLDGEGDIPVDSSFRRYGLIADPQKNQVGDEDYTETTATVCNVIKFPTSVTDNFLPGQIITQATTGAKGRVIHWDKVNKVLRYYQNEFIDAAQTGSNTDALVAFSGANAITNDLSTPISMTPDTTANGVISGAGISVTNGYGGGEIKKNSGNIIYVENRKAVNRSNDQIEDIKLVIEF